MYIVSFNKHKFDYVVHVDIRLFILHISLYVVYKLLTRCM